MSKKEIEKKAFIKPNILILGPSGSGKSTSLRNLPPETTAILNTERKALPFREGSKFENNIMLPFYNKPKEKMDYKRALDRCLTSDKIEIVISESFTSLTEHIYREAEAIYGGYDIWKNYNKDIDNILHKSKNSDKWNIFLGIDDVLENDNGVEERFAKVQGKQWRKSIEKEFEIVIYTHVSSDDNGKTQYQFITNKCEGHTNISAKSPMEMLPTIMENDLMEVIKKVTEYYQ